MTISLLIPLGVRSRLWLDTLPLATTHESMSSTIQASFHRLNGYWELLWY